MYQRSFHHVEGAVSQFDEAKNPGCTVLSAQFTVRVDVNVSAYADEYGESVEEALGRDPMDHAAQLLMEAVPDYLRAAIVVGVSDPEATT